MKHRIFPMSLMLAMIALIGVVLYWNGNYVVYILAYIFSFVFLLCYAIFAASTILEKIVQVIIYALVLAAQILFAVLVIRPADSTELHFHLYRLLGVLIILAPFLTRQICFFHHTDNCIAPSVNDWAVLSYSQLLQHQELIMEKIAKAKQARKILSKGCLREIIEDLPRYNSFAYTNDGTLTNEYFNTAKASLDNGYIYLVITKSKSPSSEVIGLFTNRAYNHVSISFDRELQTIISYNGGDKLGPPGLNSEILKGLTRRNGSTVLLYRLPATPAQKKIILDKVHEINSEGSAYNLLGLLFKASYRPNIMFCSQFTYTMLELAGLNYFEKAATHVQPTDFIELDYYRNLEYVTEITFDKANPDNGDQAYGETTE